MEEEEEITRNRELIDQLQSAVVSKTFKFKQSSGSKRHSKVLELIWKGTGSENSYNSRISLLLEIQIQAFI